MLDGEREKENKTKRFLSSSLPLPPLLLLAKTVFSISHFHPSLSSSLRISLSPHTTLFLTTPFLSSSVLFVRCLGNYERHKDQLMRLWSRKENVYDLRTLNTWTLRSIFLFLKSYNVFLFFGIPVQFPGIIILSDKSINRTIRWSFTVSRVYGASLCPNQLRGQWEIWHLRLDMVAVTLTMPGLKSVLVMILHIPCQVCLRLLKTFCLYSNNNILLWPTWNRKVSVAV